ncbi:MAG: nitrous oxide reductase accessory protein NosL, partial [Desulfuromonadales bacterium]|nr:nitrous oxide reductase accessory protein NosL [Desulfuromonadales bacterium]
VYCGMDRDKFAFSRMLIVYDDGSQMGTCSIRCAAVDLVNNLDKSPRTISVGDFQTGELLPADKAFWVIGGNKRGVMSARAKWAFAGQAQAERFIREHGGTLADFEQALQAAYTDLYEDTRLIRERRKAKKLEHSPAKPRHHHPEEKNPS